MTSDRARYRWVAILAALLLSVGAGVVAYNAGFSQGVSLSAASQGGTAMYPYAFGWHRPWGFGFGFPVLFFVFWILLFRGLWWGGPWRRRRWYRDGYDDYYRGPSGAPHGGPYREGSGRGDDPAAFEEWHRRAHERMKETPPANDPGRG